jgi:hypothetical protein
LINNSLFIDVDWNIYSSDFVITNIWKKIKNKLYLWNINNIIVNTDNLLLNSIVIEDLVRWVEWQQKLYKIMDYFSKYLNSKNKL